MAGKKQPKRMTEFEEDSLWMSWRYCIGRHTIAAYSRASDTAKFLAQFIPDMGQAERERIIFWSKDILARVTDTLNWSRELCGSVEPTYEGFDAVIERINKGEFRDESCYHLTNTIDDLLIWYSLSKWMDVNTHRDGIWKYNGKEEKRTYFETWTRIYGRVDNGQPLYKRVKVDPENFQEHGNMYLCDEYFIGDVEKTVGK